MEDQVIVESTSKNVRRRKKLLYISLLQQIEFYFSDSNLNKDRYLSQLMETDPYINLMEFLKFNKIRNLTTNIEDICKALQKSDKLRLSEDLKKVCRIAPIQVKHDQDECTIYVERLPADAEHDWLKNIFSIFGSVAYVSIPRYKHNRMIKGFAFVEFATTESATQALEYFESIDCKLPTKMPPDQLVSILTFDNDNTKIQKELPEIPPPEQTTKNSPCDIDKAEHMHTISIEMKQETDHLKKQTSHSHSDSESEPVAKIQKLDVEDKVRNETVDIKEVCENQIEENSEKRKRKRKKTSKKHQNDLKQIGLQILSKKEWKQLRNKYLNLQRHKMQNLKEHLNRGRYTNSAQSSEHSVRTSSNLQKSEDVTPRFKYSPGTIIHFQLSEICNDVRKFKTDIRSQQGIEFIDFKIGDNSGFLRFSNNESTVKFIKSSTLNAEMRVLESEEESEYWKKITKEREIKFNKESGKKQRGRDKLLRKAEKELGKHIRFENAE